MRLLAGAKAGGHRAAGAGAAAVGRHHIAGLLLVQLVLLGGGLWRRLELLTLDSQPMVLHRWPSQADALCILGGGMQERWCGREAATHS